MADSHVTHTPDIITYSSVVMRETVHSVLTTAALHGIEIKTADLINAYVMAPNQAVIGPEFGDDAGKSVIIVRALYCVKSAGALFGAHLAQCMRELEYKPYDSDPDV